MAAGLIQRAFDPAESVAERVQTAWRMRAGGSRDPRHRRSSRGLTLDRAQLSARDRVPAMRRAGRQPSRRAMHRVHRARADGARAAWTRETGPRSDPSLGRRAWRAPRAITSGRRLAPLPAFGRLESPRWPSAAVVCDAYHEPATHGTRRSSTPAHSCAFSAGATNRSAPALAEFWMATGRAPEPADLRAAGWHGPTAKTLRRRYGGVELAWEALGPVPRFLDRRRGHIGA